MPIVVHGQEGIRVQEAAVPGFKVIVDVGRRGRPEHKAVGFVGGIVKIIHAHLVCQHPGDRLVLLFRDVTGILESPDGFQLALDMTVGILAAVEFDLVAAPESRGFIFGAALADRFRTAFVPIRKPGKLPRETISESYDLEYGKATLHMHTDAVKPGQRVVIVDDLLATGGTAKAAAKLVERLGGTVVKMIFPIELEGFRAREGLLKDYDVASLVKYPGK